MDFLIAVMNSYVTGDFLVLASDGIWGDFESGKVTVSAPGGWGEQEVSWTPFGRRSSVAVALPEKGRRCLILPTSEPDLPRSSAVRTSSIDK